jgi:hypothetical protein
VHVSSSLAAIVDLDRYPIDDLESAAGGRLIASCRGALGSVGACDLEGFLQPAAAARATREALASRDEGFRTDAQHTIYFDSPMGPDAPEGDPRRTPVRTAKVGIAYDQIAAGSPLRALYESEELTRFLAAALEADPLYRHADPIGALNVMIYEPGDEIGWHFDNADFVVTLMLEPAEAGGGFEFVPMLRTESDENHAGVNALLAGGRDGVRAMSAAPGTLALFRGRRSPHRVLPVEGDRARVIAVLAYAAVPDARLSERTLELFYGRRG